MSKCSLLSVVPSLQLKLYKCTVDRHPESPLALLRNWSNVTFVASFFPSHELGDSSITKYSHFNGTPFLFFLSSLLFALLSLSLPLPLSLRLSSICNFKCNCLSLGLTVYVSRFMSHCFSFPLCFTFYVLCWPVNCHCESVVSSGGVDE